jgi:hypothetical protein
MAADIGRGGVMSLRRCRAEESLCDTTNNGHDRAKGLQGDGEQRVNVGADTGKEMREGRAGGARKAGRDARRKRGGDRLVETQWRRRRRRLVEAQGRRHGRDGKGAGSDASRKCG